MSDYIERIIEIPATLTLPVVFMFPFWNKKTVRYLHRMDGDATFICAFCGEENDVFIEPEAGTKQVFTEDCSACCRPNVLTVTIVDEEIFIETEFEG